MNEGSDAKKAIDELEERIRQTKPMIREDYVVGWYRLWTRFPALERVLIRRGLVSQEEIDSEMIKLLDEAKEDF